MGRCNMYQEKYNLNWPTYSDHLREMLHEMMKSNELTDVTLVCDDKKQFKAHKIVLSACSPVFKSIINDLPHYSSVIYLRGIQHQEMKSIIEFMYLGVASFNQERMSDFLNVAKNLEIKEISKKVEFEDGNLSNEEQDESENVSDTELVSKTQTYTNADKNTDINRQMNGDSQLHRKAELIFECDQCDSKFAHQGSLIRHIQSKHEGVKYPCNQCDYQASQQGTLIRHIQSKHEGVKYPCNQCEYQATQKGSLTNHIHSKHEGVKYPCNQCDY